MAGPALRSLILLLALGGCELPREEPLTRGDPRHGRELIEHYGCGSCHTIPGVPGAVATVGPPLRALRKRQYLAGRLVNRPENLIRWIRDPRAVDPKTAMPAVGLDEAGARDVAAYLYVAR